MKKRKLTRRPGPRTPAQKAWASSDRFRETGRGMMLQFNRQRALGPKCGARTKKDGQPCRNAAMENGRCRFHGGRTPKGDQWHVTTWPDPKSTGATRKLNRKLHDLQRIAKRREARLRAMTPDERAAYSAWLRDHAPGPAAVRKWKRRDRVEAAAMQLWFAQAYIPPPDPEAEALRRMIEAKQREIETLGQRIAALGEMQLQGPANDETT